MIDRDQLATHIEQEATLAFGQDRLVECLRGGFGPATRIVKQVFGDLGKRLGYEVAAAGYKDADEGEWLYDMVWYRIDSGLMTNQFMVLESEWKQGVLISNHVEVDGDFHKLIQARADVRVWISSAPNQEIAQQHISNCKKQLQAFSGSMADDAYVFIINDWTTKATIIEQWRYQPTPKRT